VPVIRFTDLALQKLKSEKQTRFFDSALGGFGILVGKRRKTFILVTGTDRKLQTLGQFPKTTLAEARSKALSIIDGTTGPLAAQDPKQRIDEYIRQLSSSARHKYEQKRLLERHLLPTIKNLATASKKDVLAITDALQKSPSSQLHCHRAMKAFFNYCVERDYVPSSPMQGLSLPTEQKSRDRILTNAELKHAWSKAAELNQYGHVIRLCILLGTRKGETSAIQPQWVTDEGLLIPASATKNGQEHLLPLSAAAKHYAQKIATSPPCNWNSWNKIKKSAGLTGWTIHDLRRTFASIHGKIGTPPHIIEILLNHANPESMGGFVGRIYNRYKYLPELKEALTAYQKYLETIIGQPLI
jgi:integrase